MGIGYFCYFGSKTEEPRYEKTGFFAYAKTKTQNQEADQRLCFRYTDSTIPLLSKSDISTLQPSSVAVQPGLCRTWSVTPKTGFLITRLRDFEYIYSLEPTQAGGSKENLQSMF